ncbi:putative cuticle protein [Danaus plexippus plexippus]|uniref:Cuticle protein n=1 Tax=Danaus plexippus plexippus TaxID=278856 RepID=A0A212EW36_DANPL|nr:putative cuticle protein [Danaus plexippus plexippus]
MKFLVFFFLCFVALSAAAPQFITTWPYAAPVSRTVVAGPTVVNGFDGRFTYPGFVGVL